MERHADASGRVRPRQEAARSLPTGRDADKRLDALIASQREQIATSGQFFHVAKKNTGLDGFMLHAGTFRGGQADEEGNVRFLQGGVLVTIEREL